MGLFTRRPTVAKLPAGTWVSVSIQNHALQLRQGDQYFWLEREPDNPDDPHAVRVRAAAGWVGYLDAEASRRYAGLLDLISVPIRVSAQVGFGKAVIGLAEPAVLEEWILRHRLA
ncbi:HIRAN domain-containing protein [Cryobacterium sp. AP23]